MNIYFDCETAPTNLQWFIDEIEITPPGNYKKPDTIETWLAENADILKAQAISKTAVDTSLAQIICLGFAIDDEPVQTLTGPEDEILTLFFESISTVRHPLLIGHNILEFDIPLIYHRAIINNIRPHGRFHMHYKPWDGLCFDTSNEWAGMRSRISQDRLCKLLGLPGKGEIDGSMVPGLYALGRIEEIAQYCAGDVENVRMIYKRLTNTT